MSTSALGRIVRMHSQRATGLAFDHALAVVHPRVVGSQLPPSDQREDVGGDLPRHPTEQTIQVGEVKRGCKVDTFLFVLQALRQAGFEAPQIDAVRLALQSFQPEAMRTKPKTQLEQNPRPATEQRKKGRCGESID